MKLIAVPLALLFTASVMSAQTPAPATPAKPADATQPADPKAVPAKPADPKAAKPVDPKAAKTPAKKDEKKKKEEEPKIPGVNIARPDGTWLGLEVVDGQFKLSFYDKKKKPAAPDVARANAVWPNMHSATPTDFRTVLNPSGNALVGQRPPKPPLTFTVRLTLLKGDGDNAVAVENYAVPMR